MLLFSLKRSANLNLGGVQQRNKWKVGGNYKVKGKLLVKYRSYSRSPAVLSGYKAHANFSTTSGQVAVVSQKSFKFNLSVFLAFESIAGLHKPTLSTTTQQLLPLKRSLKKLTVSSGGFIIMWFFNIKRLFLHKLYKVPL